MKKLNRYCLVIVIPFLIVFGNVVAQNDTSKVIKPILLDKETLSGVDLKKVQLKNEPEREFFQKGLFIGEDISIYVVSSESWTASMDNFPFDEFVYMLNGSANVKAEGGEQHMFNSYDFFTIPKGFTGTWEIIAGANYHYELSVITTKRASEINSNISSGPLLLDKSKISGVDIKLNDNEVFEEILSKGTELTTFLKAEKPRKIAELSCEKDQLICVLSGQVTIHDLIGR